MRKYEESKSRFLNIGPEEPVYVISVVSKLVRMPIWTLRQLDRAGLVRPKRPGAKTRLYSQHDVEWLVYIYHLMKERHVNIHGVRIILQLGKKGKK